MKDIFLHMDESRQSRARLALAVTLARRFGARLTALFARVDGTGPNVVARHPSQYLLDLAATSEAEFQTALRHAGINGRWWKVAYGEAEFVTQDTVMCARYSNLAIVGEDDGAKRVPADLAEHVIRESGRPVLVVPHAWTSSTVAGRIVIAWNRSRECIRAVHDALPLLAMANTVTVVSMRHVDTPHRPRSADVPPVDIMDHLAANGVTATIEHLIGEDIGKMDLLLSRLSDLGADLLVMGAHDHSIFSHLGSGTRHVLRHMTVPVLMSN